MPTAMISRDLHRCVCLSNPFITCTRASRADAASRRRGRMKQCAKVASATRWWSPLKESWGIRIGERDPVQSGEKLAWRSNSVNDAQRRPRADAKRRAIMRGYRVGNPRFAWVAAVAGLLCT